jgi:hypothetical protein
MEGGPSPPAPAPRRRARAHIPPSGRHGIGIGIGIGSGIGVGTGIGTGIGTGTGTGTGTGIGIGSGIGIGTGIGTGIGIGTGTGIGIGIGIGSGSGALLVLERGAEGIGTAGAFAGIPAALGSGEMGPLPRRQPSRSHHERGARPERARAAPWSAPPLPRLLAGARAAAARCSSRRSRSRSCTDLPGPECKWRPRHLALTPLAIRTSKP